MRATVYQLNSINILYVEIYDKLMHDQAVRLCLIDYMQKDSLSIDQIFVFYLLIDNVTHEI